MLIHLLNEFSNEKQILSTKERFKFASILFRFNDYRLEGLSLMIRFVYLLNISCFCLLVKTKFSVYNVFNP